MDIARSLADRLAYEKAAGEPALRLPDRAERNLQEQEKQLAAWTHRAETLKAHRQASESLGQKTVTVLHEQAGLGRLIDHYVKHPRSWRAAFTDEGVADPILAGMPRMFNAFVGHKEAIRELPPSAVLLASSPTCPVQMFRVDPFNQFDACGDGRVDVLKSGQVDKHYNLWDRNPHTVSYAALKAGIQGGGPSY